MSLIGRIAFLCGRYKGVDQRIRDNYITREISIGDYVLSGGELAAAVVTDTLVRLIPGVLSDESSALLDSFQGELLDAPVYTRPEIFRGFKVPDGVSQCTTVIIFGLNLLTASSIAAKSAIVSL